MYYYIKNCRLSLDIGILPNCDNKLTLMDKLCLMGKWHSYYGNPAAVPLYYFIVLSIGLQYII